METFKITEGDDGEVQIERAGAWFADADDVEDAVGQVRATGYTGAITVVEADGYITQRSR